MQTAVMDLYVPAEVYTNLVKMMGYRGVTISHKILNNEELVQRLNHYEYVTISGVRPVGDPRGGGTTFIIMIAPGSKYSNKSPDFKKLLRILPKLKDGEDTDVVIISEYALTTHIKKMVAVFRAENPRIHLEHHDYEIFMLEAPKHICVPLHVIATDDELNELRNKYHLDKNNFPKILQSDTQAVWLGLRPGMCVKIIRLSETAGTAIAYRICVRG